MPPPGGNGTYGGVYRRPAVLDCPVEQGPLVGQKQGGFGIQQRVGLPFLEAGEGRCKFLGRPRFDNHQFLAESLGASLYVDKLRSVRRIEWIEQHSDALDCREYLVEYLHALFPRVGCHRRHAGQVSSGERKAADQP